MNPVVNLSKLSQEHLRFPQLVCYSVLKISSGNGFPPLVNKDRKQMLSESQGGKSKKKS